ncbi:hypothetical protein [Achromobacter aloeverae]|uniref:Uncharacterized protein n=1 Tax=Achromobacter aloeverae TaxID=1750518 RepID=A0A4Q1HHF9_9BURK|nr:hypothetical protein [Achromobacter aloeverae]RXN86982.1 hypothetical protein C7R54_19040 [Achromobacter aloeverae]
MNTDTTGSWTYDEIVAHCRRYGIVLPEAQIKRMHELSATVSQTGLGIPRMPSKDREPALTFVMPTE